MRSPRARARARDRTLTACVRCCYALTACMRVAGCPPRACIAAVRSPLARRWASTACVRCCRALTSCARRYLVLRASLACPRIHLDGMILSREMRSSWRRGSCFLADRIRGCSAWWLVFEPRVPLAVCPSAHHHGCAFTLSGFMCCLSSFEQVPKDTR